MNGERPAYRSYLLRLWRARASEGGAWRASLQDPHTGERRGFADLSQLLAFLEQQLGPREDPPHPSSDSSPGHD
jgi:hypothetical protein